MNDDNVRIGREWMEQVWNRRNPEVISKLMHPDAVAHISKGKQTRGPAEWKARFWDPLTGACSRVQIQVEDVVAQGDVVVLRWNAELDHTGDGLGFPASNSTVPITGITWLRIQGGLIVEGWDGWDVTGLLVDMGGGKLLPHLAEERAR